ncbi:MAG: hypothetical protein L0G46_02630 [Kocuria sp.]|nr:hypothetical protein [Kocuria sp.]
MRHTLSVIVRADVGEDEICIAVEGCVTDQSQTALDSILRRARQLDPDAPVVLDLQRTQHCEASAVDPLQTTIDDIDPFHRTMQILPPRSDARLFAPGRGDAGRDA